MLYVINTTRRDASNGTTYREVKNFYGEIEFGRKLDGIAKVNTKFNNLYLFSENF
jgi:hypothetical protein